MTPDRKVLLVDDDREIARGLGIRLRAAGYEVITAHDGPEGLAAAVREHPDIILLDVRMPGMDGLTLLATLRDREETRRTPVVVLSANVSKQTREKALDLGARYFLGKPYQASSLISAVESALADGGRDRPEPPPAPAADPPPRTEPAPILGDSSVMTRDKTIYIVDDDPEVIRAIEARCRALGMNAVGRTDALQALMDMVKQPPDLVILDVNMPIADGSSICEKITTDDRLSAIPVIILTGRADGETVRRCKQLGAHYVRKGPDAWDRLEPVVRRLLDSAPGLPCAVGPDSLSPRAADQPALETRLPTILVIEDDADFSRALQIKLRACGLEVLRAFNGTHGVQMAWEKKPDLIITDYAMPEGHGNYVLRRLKDDGSTKDIPVFVLTGRKMMGKIDYALERDMRNLGAERYFTKPVDFELLLREMQKYIQIPGPHAREAATMTP